MKPRSILALMVFVPFTAYSLWVCARFGPLGFVPTHAHLGWASQVFLDLVIAMCVAAALVHRDARARGINPWPWIASMFAVGSVGLLAYFVVRDHLGRPTPPPA